MSPGGAKPLTSPLWFSLRPDEVEVGVEQLLVLDALDDAEHAPGQVVVDARDLSGPPDQGDDRERAVGLDVQRVAAVARPAIRGAARRSAPRGRAGAGAAARRRAARCPTSRRARRPPCGSRRGARCPERGGSVWSSCQTPARVNVKCVTPDRATRWPRSGASSRGPAARARPARTAEQDRDDGDRACGRRARPRGSGRKAVGPPPMPHVLAAGGLARGRERLGEGEARLGDGRWCRPPSRSTGACGA